MSGRSLALTPPDGDPLLRLLPAPWRDRLPPTTGAGPDEDALGRLHALVARHVPPDRPSTWAFLRPHGVPVTRLRWSEPTTPGARRRLCRAVRRAAAAGFGFPLMPEWGLVGSAVRDGPLGGRPDRAALLRPLRLGDWESLAWGSDDEDDDVRRGDAAASVARDPRWCPLVQRGWSICDPQEDEAEAGGWPTDDDVPGDGPPSHDDHCVAWCPRFGALLLHHRAVPDRDPTADDSGGDDDDDPEWLFPEDGPRNLPRSAIVLARFLDRRWAPVLRIQRGRAAYDPPRTDPGRLERLQARLSRSAPGSGRIPDRGDDRRADELHGSQDPAIRCALRLRVARCHAGPAADRELGGASAEAYRRVYDGWLAAVASPVV